MKQTHSTMTAHFREEVHESGLLKYRFKLMEDALAAPHENPDNACMCVKSTAADKEKYCQLDGIVDLSACKKGAPVVISKPHFFLGSQSLRNKLPALNPERGLHESFFDVDPVTTDAAFRQTCPMFNACLFILSPVSRYLNKRFAHTHTSRSGDQNLGVVTRALIRMQTNVDLAPLSALK